MKFGSSLQPRKATHPVTDRAQCYSEMPASVNLFPLVLVRVRIKKDVNTIDRGRSCSPDLRCGTACSLEAQEARVEHELRSIVPCNIESDATSSGGDALQEEQKIADGLTSEKRGQLFR